MKTKKRITYYVLGFGVGLALVFSIFGVRGCDWLPGDRVRYAIQNSTALISPHDLCILECSGWTKKEMFKTVEEGEVDFGKSKTKASKASFFVESYEENFSVKKYRLQKGKVSLEIWLDDKAAVAIVKPLIDSKDCHCEDLSKDTLAALYMPGDLVLEKLKANELWLNDAIICELKCKNLSIAQVKTILDDGNVLLNESFPNRTPNPVYFISKTINNTDWVFWVEKGTTKTRIKYVIDITGLQLEDGAYLIDALFQKVGEENTCGCY